MGATDCCNSVLCPCVCRTNPHSESETRDNVCPFCNSSFSLDQRGAAELRYLNAFNLRPCADRNFKSETGNGNLGDPVIWLNVSAFVLASALVKTQLVKRVALWLILRFGRNASAIFLTFLGINVLLAAFVNATAAKAALMMPLFMVISAVYGAPGTDTTNNFSRNLVLYNLV